MAAQISCFWNRAYYSWLYQIFESSNSVSPVYWIRLLPIWSLIVTVNHVGRTNLYERAKG